MAPLDSTKLALVGLALVLAASTACSGGDGGSDGGAPAAAAGDAGEAPAAGADDGEYALTQQFDLTIAVTSTKFNETRRIPRKYSCTAEDVSPPITWGDVPNGTVSLALLMESNQHPGPLWVHWLLWGIPPDARELPEGIAPAGNAPGHRPERRPGRQRREGRRVVGSLSPNARPGLHAR